MSLLSLELLSLKGVFDFLEVRHILWFLIQSEVKLNV